MNDDNSFSKLKTTNVEQYETSVLEYKSTIENHPEDIQKICISYDKMLHNYNNLTLDELQTVEILPKLTLEVYELISNISNDKNNVNENNTIQSIVNMISFSNLKDLLTCSIQ